MQRSLLPDVSVPVGQFLLASLDRPCEAVGGDFYDLSRRRDGAVLLVSDVMGLFRASTRHVEEVKVAGLPLGLLEHRGDAPCETRELALEPGDLLLVSSDGIGSVEGACGECFEDCRLRDVLAQLAGCDGRRVIDGLVAEAVGFGRGESLPDDINLIAVSRDGA